MAAVFIANDRDGIFQQGFSTAPFVSIDALDSLVGAESNLIIYTDIAVQTNEVVQYFLTFDDVIRYIHFGKGLGSLVVNGLMFSDCDSSVPGTTQFYTMIRQYRGKKVTLSMGSFTCSAILNVSSASIVGEPDTMVNFSLQLAIVESNL